MTDERTKRILDAAEALFLAHGLRATTMEAIAKAAGVAKPTLYSRYADKERVFCAVGDRAMEQFRAAFDAAIDAPGDPAERVTHAIATKYSALSRMLGQSPHAVEILAEHDRLNAASFRILQEGVVHRVTAVLAEAGLSLSVVDLVCVDKLGPNTSVETLAPELAISLQTTLYGAVLASAYTIVASRFDQRIKALEYDYDILSHGIDVLVKNEAVLEVEA